MSFLKVALIILFVYDLLMDIIVLCKSVQISLSQEVISVHI
jgi:hypothetical protein